MSYVRFPDPEAVPSVTVPITNSHAESVPSRIVLQWLDDKEDLLGESSIAADLPPGASTLQLRVPGEKLTLWTRLRYRLTRTDTQQPLAYGYHAISELSPDIFELKVGVIGAMRAGTRRAFMRKPFIRVPGTASAPCSGLPNSTSQEPSSRRSALKSNLVGSSASISICRRTPP